MLPADFLDLSLDTLTGGEGGMLDLAFAPETSGGRFFLNFTNRSGNTVVARFRRSSSTVVADPASRFDLRCGGAGGPTSLAQPFANHNGGNLVFSPDRYLYIGLGDGGSGNDPDHRAQNPVELLGKMLRIDVNVPDDHPSGYQTPVDNPFVVRGGLVPARPEIWSFGLRNPWRYSFDDPSRGGTGALILADVDQNRFEEINYEPLGRGERNYGWRNREGAHDNVTTSPPAFLPLIEPIFEYWRSAGQSVTGGYFFADFIAARVWSIALMIDPSTREATASNLIKHTRELGDIGNVSSFGIDADGELYIVSYSRGSILKIIGPPTAPPAPTGLRIIL